MSDDLRAVLECYAPSARPGTAPEPLGNAGGLSGSRLWRYRSSLGPLVVRMWPRDRPARPVLEQIHDWLFEAASLAFVPAPVRCLDGGTVVERACRLWDLSPWMPGAAELASRPNLARVRAGFAALAAFHLSLERHLIASVSPGVLSRLNELDWWRATGFEAILARIATGPPDRLGALASRWVILARSAAPLVRSRLEAAKSLVVGTQPCLRDARPEHLLFEGDRLTGLVDFGAMGMETVAADLARLSSEWLGVDRESRAEALTAYTTVRTLTAVETALMPIFEDSAALLSGARWVGWHFIEERRFEDPLAVVNGLQRGVDRLERHLSERPDGSARLSE